MGKVSSIVEYGNKPNILSIAETRYLGLRGKINKIKHESSKCTRWRRPTIPNGENGLENFPYWKKKKNKRQPINDHIGFFSMYNISPCSTT